MREGDQANGVWARFIEDRSGAITLDWLALTAGLLGITLVVGILFHEQITSLYARAVHDRAVHASAARVHVAPPDARFDPDAPSTTYLPRVLAPREVLIDDEGAELGPAQVSRSDAGRKAFEHDLAEPERPDEPFGAMTMPTATGDAATGPGLEGVATGCLAQQADEPQDTGWIDLLHKDDACRGG